MKPLIALLAGLLLLPAGASATIKVFACEPEWAALAQEVGGDQVTAWSATTGLQDVHYIQARPGLIAKVRRADLVVCTGGGLEEGWLPVLLARGNNAAVRPGAPGYLEVSSLTRMLEAGLDADRAGGHVHPQGNPHIQLDPRRYPDYARGIADRLKQVDPDNAAVYDSQLQDFLNRWQQALSGWEQQADAAGLRGKSFVAHHNSWPYLSDWLGLTQVATLEDKPGVSPTTGHLSRLRSTVTPDTVAFIVRAPYLNDRASRWLSGRTGVKAIVLPGTVGGTAEATDLFALFDIILDRLTGG